MNEKEANTIIDMIESNWKGKFGERVLWVNYLASHDPDIVTHAIARLAKRQSERPTISDVSSMILLIHRERIEDNAWRELLPEKASQPDWVKRWEVARAAGDYRVFPEQVPGYMELQKEDPPENLFAYQLPLTPVDDSDDWVQPEEYLLEGVK